MIWHLYLDVSIQLNLSLLYLFFIFPPIFFPSGNFILPSQRCVGVFLAAPFSYPFVLFPYFPILFARNPVDYAFEMYLELVITSSLQQIPFPYLHTFLLYCHLTSLILYSEQNGLFKYKSTHVNLFNGFSMHLSYKTNSNSGYKILFYVVPDCPASSHVPIPSTHYQLAMPA